MVLVKSYGYYYKTVLVKSYGAIVLNIPEGWEIVLSTGLVIELVGGLIRLGGGT